MLSGITAPFGRSKLQTLSRNPRYVTYPLLILSPLNISIPFDLHVLATPPAFVLSQDQTLQLSIKNPEGFIIFLGSKH